MPLAWSTGTRSAAEGTDLASVARTLTLIELDFWISHFRKRGVLLQELEILEAEMQRRGNDFLAGPLWRTQ